MYDDQKGEGNGDVLNTYQHGLLSLFHEEI